MLDPFNDVQRVMDDVTRSRQRSGHRPLPVPTVIELGISTAGCNTGGPIRCRSDPIRQILVGSPAALRKGMTQYPGAYEPSAWKQTLYVGKISVAQQLTGDQLADILKPMLR